MASMTEPKPDEGQDEPEFKGRGIETYKRWFRNSEEAHAPARKLAHRDRDWYDNFDDDQWDETEKAILRKRGQPIVTSNRIKRKVNFLCGIEQKQRSDPRAFPRQPENEEQAAVVTDVLDYIETETRFDKVATNAFRNLCVEGIQIVEVMFDDDIECRMVDYDQYFYDPRSKDADSLTPDTKAMATGLTLKMPRRCFPARKRRHSLTDRSLRLAIWTRATKTSLDITGVMLHASGYAFAASTGNRARSGTTRISPGQACLRKASRNTSMRMANRLVR